MIKLTCLCPGSLVPSYQPNILSNTHCNDDRLNLHKM